MQIESVSLHPEFPEKVWIIVEQPRDESIRLAYNPINQTFTPTQHKSLTYARGFHGVYGWIGGSGIPPQPHFDVLLSTDQCPQPGDVLEGYIMGVFFRRDGDYKFVALDVDLGHTVFSLDISSLDEATHKNLMDLYPDVDASKGEGWYGAQVALDYLRKNTASHD